MRSVLAACTALVLMCWAPAGVRADRLRLVPAGGGDRAIRAVALQPIDFDLVAERDSAHTQVSAIAYTLEVPDGIAIMGEELQVESLLGIGTTLTGMNLVFRCEDRQPLHVLHFRVVATRPVHDAVIALRPDTRTDFLGVIACREEDFAKFESPPDSLTITTR
jgi:hypothetical protein